VGSRPGLRGGRRVGVVLAIVLGGAALWAAPAGPPLRVHMISGSKEYESERTLKAFQTHIEARYSVKCTLSLADDGGRDAPGLEAIDSADVLLVFCRRLRLPEDQIGKIRAWCAAGKPVVGIRTASHGFQTWLEFDREVLGGNYSGHGGREEGVPVLIEEAARDHPILTGIAPWKRRSKVYRNPSLAPDVTVLLSRPGEEKTHPLAWARVYDPVRNGHAFYTVMGLPEDFENALFRRLLVNAIHWTAGRPVPGRRGG